MYEMKIRPKKPSILQLHSIAAVNAAYRALSCHSQDFLLQVRESSNGFT